jgi:outer membrane immunogenic protein
MKKFLLGSVGLAAMIAGPAVAADMPLKAPPPVAIFSWTGCYVGAHVGGKASDSDVSYGNSNFGGSGASATGKIHMSGALGGGQIGCNYQWGTWVFGVEGDGSAVQSDGQGFETFAGPPSRLTFRDQTTEHWMATARARLGYAQDKWLIYVTGGGAWADLQTTVSPTAIAGPGSLAAIQKNTLSGWTVGVGAEYALGYGWSIKGEYLYMDFSSSNYFNQTTPFAGGVLGTDYNVRLRQSVARFGMNYKFDWGGPVVAKY